MHDNLTVRRLLLLLLERRAAPPAALDSLQLGRVQPVALAASARPSASWAYRSSLGRTKTRRGTDRVSAEAPPSV